MLVLKTFLARSTSVSVMLTQSLILPGKNHSVRGVTACMSSYGLCVYVCVQMQKLAALMARWPVSNIWNSPMRDRFNYFMHTCASFDYDSNHYRWLTTRSASRKRSRRSSCDQWPSRFPCAEKGKEESGGSTCTHTIAKKKKLEQVKKTILVHKITCTMSAQED